MSPITRRLEVRELKTGLQALIFLLRSPGYRALAGRWGRTTQALKRLQKAFALFTVNKPRARCAGKPSVFSRGGRHAPATNMCGTQDADANRLGKRRADSSAPGATAHGRFITLFSKPEPNGNFKPSGHSEDRYKSSSLILSTVTDTKSLRFSPTTQQIWIPMFFPEGSRRNELIPRVQICPL